MSYERRVFERYLTVAEERRLLRTVARVNDILARRDHAWMRLLRHTGIRLVTLCGLTVFDAREALRTRYLTIRPDNNKGHRGGRVFINRSAQKALRDLLAARRAMGYAEHPDEPLVMSRNHRPMSRRSYQARMSAWCKAAGLEVDASPHWWRHTLAKRLMSQSTAEDPRGIVQRALLHQDLKTTMVYTMPDRDAYEQAMEEAS